MITDATLQHLRPWLEDHVHADEREATTRIMLKMINEHPDLVDAHSWPEIRDLAEKIDRWTEWKSENEAARKRIQSL